MSMKYFSLSTFLASILLITSCGDSGDGGKAMCDVPVNGDPGTPYNVCYEGQCREGTIPEGGVLTVTIPCDALIAQ